MKRFDGFSLVELVVVLAVAAGLFLVAQPHLEMNSKKQTALRINHDAQLILESMNQYYHKSCLRGSPVVMSESNLRTEGYLKGASTPNPWGGAFQLGIDRTSVTNPLFIVSVVFDDTKNAAWVADFSDESSLSGSTVTWTKNSSLSRSMSGFHRQSERAVFGSPLC